VYVTRVQLENIRGFTGARDVDLAFQPHGGWTVLAGRNGSGKTTLLQAIALTIAGPAAADNLVGSFEGWLSVGGSAGHASTHITVDSSLDRAYSGEAWSEHAVLRLEWRLPPTGAKHHGGRRVYMGPDARYGHGLSTPHPDTGPWTRDPVGWFCAGYGPFRRLIGGSDQARRLMRARGAAGRMATLFHEDASLAESVS
jgi:hypothetical protein